MNKFMKSLKELDIGVVVRTVALFVAFANQILSFFGISPIPFDQESFSTFVSLLVMGIVSIWAWWKNNSFTKEAKQADNYLKSIKKKK